MAEHNKASSLAESSVSGQQRTRGWAPLFADSRAFPLATCCIFELIFMAFAIIIALKC